MKYLILSLIWVLMILVLVLNGARIEYGLDSLIGAIKPDCTIEMYMQDREQCIWDSLKD